MRILFSVQSMTDKVAPQLWSAITPLLLGVRHKWMIPSFCPWKVVTFFGKEHLTLSHSNGKVVFDHGPNSQKDF